MEKASWGEHSRSRAWGIFQTASHFRGVRIVVLSKAVKVAFPSLFLSSLPKKAIGFSYPSGREGKILGGVMVAVTCMVGLMLFVMMGPVGPVLALWLVGGTTGLIVYNSTREKLAFVKEYCSTCRLRPLIEEHEAMHLYGERHEEAVWADARRRHDYVALHIEDDPKICTFCPIAKKLRNN